ncbi:MAG TPA: phosphoribosylglycinamide formyltransferase [Bacillota bacterium]|nr:phosphoribosylglycinamide formyltransferase [Bacillota bacterium]
MKHLAVFASGRGSNYEAIENAILNNEIDDCCISLLVCDNQDAHVIKLAEKFKRKTFVFDPKGYKNKSEYESDIVEQLKEHKVDLICLAGYMGIIGDILLEAYPNRIINIHPSLLPSFKGSSGIKDAFEYGVKVFGITIHYVSKEIDSGEIIAQRAFEYDGDKIEEVEACIHKIEHELYPQTIKKLIKEQGV